VILSRREILERDTPVNFRDALQVIRNLTGWGSSDLAFVLNVARGTLHSWESGMHRPNHDDGQAILKLLTRCRHFGTCEAEIVA